MGVIGFESWNSYALNLNLISYAVHTRTATECYVLSHFSCVPLFATLWAVACQTPLSMGFSRKECWSG